MVSRTNKCNLQLHVHVFWILAGNEAKLTMDEKIEA